ncbi:MAG: DUF4390 domain-containing protein [Acidobacteriota bacterium]
MRRVHVLYALPLVLAVLSLGPGQAQAAGEGRLLVSDLSFDQDGEGIYVTMRIDGAFSPQVRDMLQSGVPLSFQYTIKVRKKRTLWFARTVVSRQIETRAKLDALSKEYTLETLAEGQLLDARASADSAAVMEHLSHLVRVKIAEPGDLEAGETYDLQAKAKVLDEFVLYVIPWAIETPWQSKVLLPTPAAR